eukprot:TRINITY_DN1643_c0_g1_i1.p1 TRINITY_DN1643_c0_g1~~TRINITY_DN1643_c0_g1_i1.p1  ORF type:complete len:200 (-),score=24.31 TRINITY_DN1643_c0_g1_i1:26-625(-)
MSLYSITTLAYIKLILHALKYPASTVNGVLLGSEKGKGVIITEAVPLFHGNYTLPMLEIALLQIEEYCNSHTKEKNDSLEIVGYYHANERLEDSNLNSAITTIADKLQSYYPSSCILMIDNQKISLDDETEEAVTLYTRQSGSWVNRDKIEIDDKKTKQTLSSCLENNLVTKVYDFAEHLEDISKDWISNLLLSSKLKK